MEKHEYYKTLDKLGIIRRIYCSKQEGETFKNLPPEELPSGVQKDTTESEARFFRYPDTSDAEISKGISLLNAKNIKTIKNCVVFFTVLAVIGICATIVLQLLR